jgi:hypothetical protein
MDPEDIDAMAYVEGWKWEYEPLFLTSTWLTAAEYNEDAEAQQVVEGFQYDVSPL